MIRLITTSSLASRPISCSLSSRSCGTGEKSASTAASSSPWRITSAETLLPKMRASALRMMVFPAPVSPVSTFKPASKSRATSSITAKCLIRSSRNMNGCLPLTPLQFSAQDLEVTPPGDLDQKNRDSIIPGFHDIAVIECYALPAIRAQKHRITGGTQRHANLRFSGHDNWAVRKRMGADGDQRNGAQRRIKDPPTRRQSIGRRAGWRGNDEPIGPVRAQILLPYIRLQVDNPRARTLGDDPVVKDTEGFAQPFVAINPQVQGHAIFNQKIPPQSILQ